MVWGIADLHMHLAAHLGFGGRLLAGQPDHPDGMSRALGRCEGVHGVGGTGLGAVVPLLSMIESTGHGAGIGHMTGGWEFRFDGWPRFTSTIHQQAYVDWIRRAHDGCLRLIVSRYV